MSFTITNILKIHGLDMQSWTKDSEEVKYKNLPLGVTVIFNCNVL